MRYVLDSSVAVKWVLAETDSDKALRLRAAARLGRHEFVAADVYPFEFMHSVTRAERQKRLSLVEGRAALVTLLSELPVLYPSLDLLPRAYALSSAFRIGVYDCLYVALAEREGCDVVTADARLVNALGPTFPFITALASSP